MSLRRDGRLGAAWIAILIVLPFAAALIALGIGRMSISPGEVLDVLRAALAGKHVSSGLVEKTVLQLRLPRIILAVLVGAGLSVSGCAFQSLFANPLATPDTLGVASGAAFGAALGILLGFDLIGIQLMGLAIGGAAVTLTWLAGSGKDRGGLSYIVLSGIMIGSLFSALISFVKFAADAESQLPAITYWLMGGLDKANYGTLSLGAPVIIAGVLVFMLIRWRMNLLPLSDDEARASGVNIRLLRVRDRRHCLVRVDVRTGRLGGAPYTSHVPHAFRQQPSFDSAGLRELRSRVHDNRRYTGAQHIRC